MIRKAFVAFLIFAIILGSALFLFGTVPTGFVPDEDQGYFMINVQLPEGASLERSDAAVKEVEEILKNEPGVRDYFALGGFNLITSAYSSYTSTVFAILEPWDARKDPSLSVSVYNAENSAEIQRDSGCCRLQFQPTAYQRYWLNRRLAV